MQQPLATFSYPFYLCIIKAIVPLIYEHTNMGIVVSLEVVYDEFKI